MMGLAGFLGAALIVYGFYRVFYRGGIWRKLAFVAICLLYTSDAADE